MIETIFDTLNAKAAIFAIERDLARRAASPAGDDLRHHHRPVRPHALRPDAGSLLAFGAPRQALRHRPQLRARRQGIAPLYRRAVGRVADTLVCAHPNAGLPNEFGDYDETPENMARLIGEFAALRPRQHRRRLLRHHAGAYRGDRRRRSRDVPPRAVPDDQAAVLRLSGLEPFDADARDPNFVNVGERTNVTGSAKFRKLIAAGDYDAALRRRARAGRERRPDHRHQHGRGPARFRSGDDAASST